ncbi:MAG: ferritin family protein [Chloroflexota bacterium]|nr:ferritin family protein [Chloroflexota bacterium]
MQEEVIQVIEAAMYKETAARAIYEAGIQKSSNAGAQALMKELAEDEKSHMKMLEEFKDKGWKDNQWNSEEINDLKISEYLTGSDKLEDASLQDTLVFAMKREQQAVEFYSRLMKAVRTADAKELCERLVHEELKHKRKLELLYDELFYVEH